MSAVETAGAWIVTSRRDSLILSPDRERVYSFDLEGRPLSWFEAGRTYKRSLGSWVFGRERAGGGRRRWRVTDQEAANLFAGILDVAGAAPMDAVGAEARERIDRVLTWSPARLLAERERFSAAYRPISILPPDQYLSIVIQASFGCSWNRCSFCSFYQGRPFRARRASELREHVAAVSRLLGRGAVLRRSLFLADGNALILSNDRLREIFHVAREAYPGRPIDSFVDVFTGERKPVSDWEELRELGLRRVHVGLETGHDPLLRWIDKPGGGEDALDFVRVLRRAGLSLSLIVMVGVGGRRFAEAHERDTLSLLARVPLAPGDIVYLSPFVVHEDSEYARRAASEGVAALAREGLDRQYARLRDEIRRRHPAAKVARYDIREFVY